MNRSAKEMADLFFASLEGPAPPPGYSPALQSLWFAAKGDLDRALTVTGEGQAMAWVQAHLRRSAGDLPSARHWYARAGRPVPVLPVERERVAIVRTLLANPT